ncbi:MFS transporter [Vibrio parahaemolyticus]|uniref:Multidrug resistance protein n=6 Tax=Vibrio parahaemolyticus TaxID=670 RepID=A0A0L8URI2_VIBPH|nr:MFS transporter [Vibrio parahaemolyticus]EDM60975.1 permease of the major facilitator superfamily [Vibrio parahaemolyticus AQ3810]EFO37431.1 permease, major facilitator family [Vibrio parahaemolyticus Peru-466]EFO50640.1 permease, major facilitator family [Vibrio parahaemolyticus K5030]ARC17450.1 MFS transporter [Vibrio parahaemolyticus]AZV71171.1 MFS transporter [Vibrio parahaemolyticus]
MVSFGTPEYKRITLSLALGSFLVFSNLYLLQPMLPTFATLFSISETQVNWLFAASTLALSFSLVPMAVLSESIGRKPVMMVGLFSIPAISALMLLGDSFIFLVACRALIGIALAAFAAVAVAYMAEELDKHAFSMAIGTYIAANSLGGIAGRISGGLLADNFSVDVAIEVMMVVTLIGVICVHYLLPKQRNFTPSSSSLRHQNRAIIGHFRNQRVWFAMLIGGLNFALFVNLYSVMGFRLVSAPHNVPVGLASLIFICYLGGTFSSRCAGHWSKRYSSILGMFLGAVVSMAGMWIAAFESLAAMLISLLLISFGAFFTHTLAYGWVGQNATQAKATATALYLVHYYVGGSLGGFLLLYCWQHGGWSTVLLGGSVLYAVMFAAIAYLKHICESVDTDSNTDVASLGRS